MRMGIRMRVRLRMTTGRQQAVMSSCVRFTRSPFTRGNWNQSVTNCGHSRRAGITQSQRQRQRGRQLSLHGLAGTWLFSNAKQSAPKEPLFARSSIESRLYVRVFTLHYYVHDDVDGGQWSTGQLVSRRPSMRSAGLLNYVTLGKFINFLCLGRANRFAVINISINMHWHWHWDALLTCEGCGQFACYWHASLVSRRSKRWPAEWWGGLPVMQIKVSLSINVLGHRSMSAT